MDLSREAAFAPWCLVFLLIAARVGLGHEPTAKRFERQRAAALAYVQKTAEPAPRGDGQEAACRLTIELLADDEPQPVAGLIRVTNLETGKPISFADEIHRDKNWYAVAPRTTLLAPRAKLKVPVVGRKSSLLIAVPLDV